MCAKRATRSICRSLPNSGVEIALPDGLPRGEQTSFNNVTYGARLWIVPFPLFTLLLGGGC